MSKVSPQVDVSPKNQTVPEGYTANFTCKAKGIPKPTVVWNFKNGDLPSNAAENQLDEGLFLQLSSTTKDMEGIYTCTASNKANTTTSAANLHVLGVCVCGFFFCFFFCFLVLFCLFIFLFSRESDSHPGNKNKDGKKLPCQGPVRHIFKSKLLVCLSSENPTAEITPNPHPTLMVGDELKLTCEVNEVTTDIKWLKNGALVSSRAHVSPRVGDKSILSIEKVVEDDSGEYSCEASNEAGIVSRSPSVKITVRGKISFHIARHMYYLPIPLGQ